MFKSLTLSSFFSPPSISSKQMSKKCISDWLLPYFNVRMQSKQQNIFTGGHDPAMELRNFKQEGVAFAAV